MTKVAFEELWDARWVILVTLLFAASLLWAVFSYAQDANDRTRAALPALVEQRNNALDAAALCQGDIAILKAQLAEAKAEIEKLKAPK
jgi:5-bromo-4-chloroindolyl phosphate hydrolysis protein